MSTLRFATLAGLALAALPAAPAAGGELAIEAHGGYAQMAAENSASALFDARGAGTFGGAVRYTFWRGLFVSAGARTFSLEGERVFVKDVGSPVQKLGFPLSLRVTPISLAVGYRLFDGRTLVPYAAAGAAVTRYSETSEVAGEVFDESRSKTGFLAAIGLELGRGTFRAGAEAGFSSVPDAIGLGGVSKVFGEDDLGGTYVLGKLIVAF